MGSGAQLLQLSVVLAQREGDISLLARSLYNLGYTARKCGDGALARQLLDVRAVFCLLPSLPHPLTGFA